jgi:photosystem II stability/assembly factor-like uncharacterized protein
MPAFSLRRWRSGRRRAADLDRALDATLAGAGRGPQELQRELTAARAVGASAAAHAPPDEVPIILRAALAARDPRPQPRRLPRTVWRPATAVALLAAGLIVVSGLAPGRQPQPDQTALARNLQLVRQQMAQVESQAALGNVVDLNTKAQQVRAALLRAEQAVGQLDPADPRQASLLATLESEIVSLNQLLARLHLDLSPLPTLPTYLPTTTAPVPASASPAPAAPSSTTTTTTAQAASGVASVTPLPPTPAGPMAVVANSDLAFPDGRHGWLVVPGQPSGSPTKWSASRILATTDGGHRWDQQLDEDSAPLTGVDFVDPDHGWTVAGATGPIATAGGQAVYGAALLRTTDGGTTWRQVGEPTSPLGQVHFTDSQRGWGVTADDQVVRTLDGGDTWLPAGTSSSGVPPVSSLCVTGNGNSVWAATPGEPLGSGTPMVLRTDDGGAHWTVPFRGRENWGAQQADIGCSGPSAWVVFDLSPGAGQQPAVVERTGDDGLQWLPVLRRPGQPGPAPVSVLGHAGPLDVIDASTAHFSEACPACGPPQAAVVTSGDGGMSYSMAALPGSGSPLQGMAFVDADRGYMATVTPPNNDGPTSGIQVFTTADGARTWQLVFTG